MRFGIYCAAATLAAASAAMASPTLNQVNDFQNGQVSGWSNGGSAADPVLVPNGGNGDGFLHVSATGGSGAGSHLVTFNTNSRWTGNFTTAGVTAVTMDLKNLGTAPLSMRIAFDDSSSTWYASTQGFALPADNAWHTARFELAPTALTRVSGSTALATALTRVTEFRIVHTTDPDYRGDIVAASFGVDNIRAVPEPTSVATLAAASLPLLRRRRRPI
jgi:hypothetical protein